MASAIAPIRRKTHHPRREADPKHAEVARNNIARAGLVEVVEVRVGRASVSQMVANTALLPIQQQRMLRG